MSSSACCCAQSADTYERHWNCEKGFGCNRSAKAAVSTRRKREFTPDEQKDDNYWMKRSRNNQAAKRSRERRRVEERLLEERALQLLRENEKLRAALSSVNYHGVAEQTSHDTFLDCFSVPELARDSYMRSMVDLQANRIPHYALSRRCDFTSTYNSVFLPRVQSFPAATFPANNTHLADRCVEIHARRDGNVPSSVANVSYAITQSKWPQGYAHPTVNPHSAPLSPNEVASGYQCSAAVTPGRDAHVHVNAEQRARVTKPKELEISKEAERVSTSPLLPHKLRYKINKLRLGGDF
ncbi:nuclear factor, interleukin 3 regulated, member 6 [Silurus asotus]|uniref:Nuclear factor, interleukin 3 regulated, member 6 n=1 Tax=Silurus asotus TaxID=30991 RepID=A0AAD5AED2_SILAS|nr:nuclear factor, interleukin 3 regulated, member 6 [Silurus asotus]